MNYNTHDQAGQEPAGALKSFFSNWFDGSTDLIRLLRLATGEAKGSPSFYESVSEIPIHSLLSDKLTCNVYFNVTTLREKNGRKETVSEIPGIWADMDGKAYLTGKKCDRAKELCDRGEGKGKWEGNPQTLTPEEFTRLMGLIEEGKANALDALNKLPLHLQPTFIVDSGKGYQVYWRFRELIKVNGSNSIVSIETLNKRMATLLGSDHTGNANRIFRAPYTNNVKLKGWGLRTEIIAFHPERQFDPTDFEEWLPEAEFQQTQNRAEADISDIPDNIPDRFWSLLKKNIKLQQTWEGKRQDLKDNSGSGLDMALAHQLIQHGFIDGEIARILLEAPYEKSSERTEAYLRYTIGKARGRAEETEPSEYKAEGARRVLLSEVKEAFKKWLVLKDDNLIDMSLATIVVNYFLDADPLWVLLVSPPSGAKTEILRAMDGCRNIHFCSSLTPKTLVSGQKGATEVSLLSKLTNKIIVLKDFTTILEMREDDKSEIFAQLREIYDGKFDKYFGTGKEFHWKGHLGFLAGVTQAIDESMSVKNILGDRFIYYRCPEDIEEGRKKTARQAMKNTKKESTMRGELQEIVKAFLTQFGNTGELPSYSDEIAEKIVCLSDIISRARTSVPREWSGTRDIKYVPNPENPPRLAKQFTLAGCGLAIVRGSTEISEEEYKVVKKIALDSMPDQRRATLKALWNTDWLKTREVSESMRYPVPTAKRYLEDMHVLKIVERQFNRGMEAGDAKDTTPYEWRLNLDFLHNMEEAGINEDDF